MWQLIVLIGGTHTVCMLSTHTTKQKALAKANYWANLLDSDGFPKYTVLVAEEVRSTRTQKEATCYAS
jgi:hypothetical protein